MRWVEPTDGALEGAGAPRRGAGQRSAGDISQWLSDTLAAADGIGDADVPCDGCTGCCESSQFVHIGPAEVDTRASIPDELLFPAPGLPDGHVLMGYDEHGRCPMLVAGACSIYAVRPVTCRVFDCRVFAATGVEPDPSKPLIAHPARRWKFDTSDERGAAELEALRAAAEFVNRWRDDDLFEAAKHSATGHAVLAVEIHDEFLGGQAVDDDRTITALRLRRSSTAR